MTQQEYMDIISREPTADMISEGKGYRYIKKSVLKHELLSIFGGHTRFEMITNGISKNGLYGTGLFHYKHPVSGDWLFESGMAAIPHQSAMKLDYPLLKAQVFKNAVREIGIWFGLTLNAQIDDIEPEDELPTINAEDERMEVLIDNCKSLEDLAKLKAKLNKVTKKFYSIKLIQLTKDLK